MGISERKEKQKLEIKKQILDASMKLFVEQGFEKVSIRKIADLIEYSPTTVYLYFKDKNEILFNLHELGFQKMIEYNKELLNIEDPLERLRKLALNYVQFGLENPEFYDLMFIQEAPMEAIKTMPNCDWQCGETALGTLRQVIAECMEKGLILKGDEKVVAMACWGMAHGLVSLSIRRRFEKLVDAVEVEASIQQSLAWFLKNITQKE